MSNKMTRPADAVGSSRSSASSRRRIVASALGRLLDCGRFELDFPSLTNGTVPIRDDAPGRDAWASIRHKVAVLPGARRHASATTAGIIRRSIEEHAIELRERLGLREIVDRRLAFDLDDIVDRERCPDDKTVVIRSRWGRTRASGGRRRFGWRRSLVAASIGGLLAAVLGDALLRGESPASLAGLFGLASSWGFLGGRFDTATVPSNPGPDPHGSEVVKVGRGWIETGSGRRRHRQDMVTTVAFESDASERIEVRIVGVERVVRLRFDSLADPDFRAFWSRWAA